MRILDIFNEISAEPGSNAKMDILSKYSFNETLEQVLYLALSKRIKFYIKVIPTYSPLVGESSYKLEDALIALKPIYEREITGEIAKKLLVRILSNLHVDDAVIIEKIIAKDVRIGMGRTNINKVFSSLIEKTPYMGAKAFDESEVRELLSEGEAFSQIKMDGRYCNAIIRGGEVELESRSGEPTILAGADFLRDLAEFPDCVLNGELTIDGIDRYTSNGIISSLVSIGGKMLEGENVDSELKKFYKQYGDRYKTLRDALDDIRFTVWDRLDVVEYFDKKSNNPYWRRLRELELIIINHKPKMVSLIKSKKVKTYAEAIEHFKEVLAEGEEGTILKSVDGKWADKKPKWQIKFKLMMDVDLKIIDFNYGSGKNKDVISSLTVESSCGRVVTKPAGITEDMMKYITANQDRLKGTIVECQSCGLSSDRLGNYALLHPVFKKLRDDKTEADSLESIQAIENMVKGLS